MKNAIDTSSLSARVEDATCLVKSLANHNRLLILCCLAEKELSVNELNKRVSVSQSALSQHLANLRNSGLVATRREGRSVFYRILNRAAIDIILVLKNHFCQDS